MNDVVINGLEALHEANEFVTGIEQQLERLRPYADDALAKGADPDLVKLLLNQSAHVASVQWRNAQTMHREGAYDLMTYHTPTEFILREGVPYTPPTRPRPPGMRKGTNKMCFRNAWHAVWDRPDDERQYVEGYAISDSGNFGFPIHHAWVWDHHSESVIETTWAKPGVAYFGVPFLEDTVSLAMRLSGTYGVIEDLRHHYPILDSVWDELSFQHRLRELLEQQAQGAKR